MTGRAPSAEGQTLLYADYWPERRSKETDGQYMTRARNWQSWAQQERPNLWHVSEQEHAAWAAWKATLPTGSDRSRTALILSPCGHERWVPVDAPLNAEQRAVEKAKPCAECALPDVHTRGEFVLGLGWSCLDCDTFGCPVVNADDASSSTPQEDS